MNLIENIKIVGEHEEEIGETYPRRAKQLVKNGRAIWLEDGVSIQLVNKEPNDMYTNNGVEIKPPPMPLVDETEDKLLLYLAKRTIAKKKELLRHVIAYVISWFTLAVLNGARFFITDHPRQWAANSARDLLHHYARYATVDRVQEVMDNAAWQIGVVTRNHVSPLWYALLGAMAFWSVLIIVKAKSYFALKGEMKPGKVDPVLQEYQRLKNATVQDLR